MVSSSVRIQFVLSKGILKTAFKSEIFSNVYLRLEIKGKLGDILKSNPFQYSIIQLCTVESTVEI